MKKVFISYVYEDRSWRSEVEGWFRHGLVGQAMSVSESEDKRQDGRNAVRHHLSEKLTEADCVLLFVGNDSHNRPWLDYEIQYALSHQKPVVSVRIPDTLGAPPLAVRRSVLVQWKPSEVRAALGL